MLKEITLITGLILGLSACTNSPSPQNTTPSNEAQCAALRTQILQAPMQTSNNTPSALADGQNVNAQDQYHKQCE